MDFSNRELATYAWLGVVFTACMAKRDIRTAAFEVAKTFFAPKLLVLWVVVSIYLIGVVWALQHLAIWRWDNLKTTILWAVSFVFAAISEISKVSTHADERVFFQRTLKDALGLSAVITFVIEMHSFSLITEMIAVPMLTIIALMQIVAQHDEKTEIVSRLLKRILFCAGVFYIGFSFYETTVNFQQTATLETLREFGIPVILTLSFIPFLYFVLFAFTYERAFIRLVWQIPDKSLRRRAKLEAVIRFGPRLDLVRRWADGIGSVRPNDVGELRQSFNDVLQTAREEKSPPNVKSSEGWSPHLARNFLENHGLNTKPYHRTLDDEWSASSRLVTVRESRGLANNLAYYLEGTGDAAKSLKLRVYINRPEEAAVADEHFIAAGHTLIQKALKEPSNDLTAAFGKLASFQLVVEGTFVELRTEEWTGGVPGGFERTLHIKR